MCGLCIQGTGGRVRRERITCWWSLNKASLVNTESWEIKRPQPSRKGCKILEEGSLLWRVNVYGICNLNIILQFMVSIISEWEREGGGGGMEGERNCCALTPLLYMILCHWQTLHFHGWKHLQMSPLSLCRKGKNCSINSSAGLSYRRCAQLPGGGEGRGHVVVGWYRLDSKTDAYFLMLLYAGFLMLFFFNDKSRGGGALPSLLQAVWHAVSCSSLQWHSTHCTDWICIMTCLRIIIFNHIFIVIVCYSL